MDTDKTLASVNPAKKAFSLFEEFKSFAFKGNVIDLSVGVIIGIAFGKIISSLVDNIIMPVIGLILPGDKGYEGWAVHVGDKVVPYGKFLGDIVYFLIVALALFLFVVKFLGWILRTKKHEGPPPLTKDQQLLVEIRDLLQKNAASAPAP